MILYEEALRSQYNLPNSVQGLIYYSTIKVILVYYRVYIFKIYLHVNFQDILVCEITLRIKCVSSNFDTLHQSRKYFAWEGGKRDLHTLYLMKNKRINVNYSLSS